MTMNRNQQDRAEKRRLTRKALRLYAESELEAFEDRCWNCGEVLPADRRADGDTCPICDADVVPF